MVSLVTVYFSSIVISSCTQATTMAPTTRASARKARPSENVAAVVLLPRRRVRVRACTHKEAREREAWLALVLSDTQKRMLQWRAISEGEGDDRTRCHARDRMMAATRDLIGAYDDLQHARGVLQEFVDAERAAAPPTPPV